MAKHSKFYQDNAVYTSYLSSLGSEDYRKVAAMARRYLRKGGNLLDVGCGTGQLLELVRDSRWRVQGVEISRPSVKLCREKGLSCKQYTGQNFPFKNDSFSVVTSFNVLEHVDSPEVYLLEVFRVLKSEGVAIVVCPNFLAVSNSFHRMTRGANNKIRNLLKIFAKLNGSEVRFQKMSPVKSREFRPDDDAVNLTNPIDIRRWAKEHNFEEVYWSSQEVYRQGAISWLDRGWLKYFLGSCFFVFRKP